MHKRSGIGGVGLVLLLLAVSASTASALTLADLDVAGASFSSLDGSLLFSEFDGVEASGGLNSDLTNYTVVPVDFGFRIVGPIGVAGDEGILSLSYKVSAAISIVGADVFFNGAAFGDDAVAELTSRLVESMGGSGIPGGELDLLVTGDGTKIKVDSTSFEPILEFFVDEVVRVDASNAAAATVSAVDLRFALVPEPATALMLGMGLFGLAAVGRSRAGAPAK